MNVDMLDYYSLINYTQALRVKSCAELIGSMQCIKQQCVCVIFSWLNLIHACVFMCCFWQRPATAKLVAKRSRLLIGFILGKALVSVCMAILRPQKL